MAFQAKQYFLLFCLLLLVAESECSTCTAEFKLQSDTILVQNRSDANLPFNISYTCQSDQNPVKYVTVTNSKTQQIVWQRVYDGPCNCSQKEKEKRCGCNGEPLQYLVRTNLSEAEDDQFTLSGALNNSHTFQKTVKIRIKAKFPKTPHKEPVSLTTILETTAKPSKTEPPKQVSFGRARIPTTTVAKKDEPSSTLVVLVKESQQKENSSNNAVMWPWAFFGIAALIICLIFIGRLLKKRRGQKTSQVEPPTKRKLSRPENFPLPPIPQSGGNPSNPQAEFGGVHGNRDSLHVYTDVNDLRNSASSRSNTLNYPAPSVNVPTLGHNYTPMTDGQYPDLDDACGQSGEEYSKLRFTGNYDVIRASRNVDSDGYLLPSMVREERDDVQN